MFARTTKELPEKIKTKYSNTCAYLRKSKIINHSSFTIHYSPQPKVAVITLILLLILAGITISYITGGGQIDKTQVAMNEYDNADKKQQDIIDDINDYNKQEIDLEPVYSEEGAEDNIAPLDLFEYEIINDGSVASSYMQNLPTKTARIKGIKPEYIDIQEISYNEWYYKIKYEGITDVLVIPYEVELDKNANVTENGEMYKITEVDLAVKGYKEFSKYHGSSFPSIKKVIYPNTVEKINRNEETGVGGNGVLDQPLEIILSKNIRSIGEGAFSGLPIESIELPEGITNISDYGFFGCNSLKSIIIPNNVTSIGEYAFDYCNNLENLEIPTSVTNIEKGAFAMCYELKKIIIPTSVKYIGSEAFLHWDSNQTIYFECSEEESKNWDSNWNSYCDANIVWNYNPDETTE